MTLLTVLVTTLAIVSVLLVSPAFAEEMTREQETAMTEIFTESQAGGKLFSEGRFAEAEAIFRRVVEKTEATFPGEALMRASGLHNLAAALSELGRIEEAHGFAVEALSLREKNGAIEMPLANSRALLAEILREYGRTAEATGLMEQAVQAMTASADADPADLITNASELIDLYARSSRFAEADQLAADLIALLPQLTEAQKVDVYWGVARLKAEQASLGEADRNYRLAYEALAKAAPKDVVRRAILISNIASILRQQYRRLDAENLFRRASSDLEKTYPEGHSNLATALDGLGLTIAEQGQPAEAWPILRRALDMRLALLPKDHPLIATSLVNLGLALLRDGQFEIARDSFQSAVTGRQALGDEVGAARAGINLAVAQHALGDTAGGIQSLKNVRAVFGETLPGNHPLATTAAIDQAWLLLALGDFGEALSVAREASAALVAARGLSAENGTDVVPPDEDKRRIVVAVVAAWEAAKGN